MTDDTKIDPIEAKTRVEAASFFSDVCRNAPKVVFRIVYTGTDGNIDVDKRFQDFCFKYANNEYLQGISLLLRVFEHYQELSAIDAYVNQIEQRLILLDERVVKLEAGPKIEKKTELKTF